MKLDFCLNLGRVERWSCPQGTSVIVPHGLTRRWALDLRRDVLTCRYQLDTNIGKNGSRQILVVFSR